MTSVLAALFSNFELTLHETDEETMDWRDQTLLVNRSHVMAFVKPINFPSPDTNISRLEDPDSVILPDLFISWASAPIKLNANYAVVAPEAETWFQEYVPIATFPKPPPLHIPEFANTMRKHTENI